MKDLRKLVNDSSLIERTATNTQQAADVASSTDSTHYVGYLLDGLTAVASLYYPASVCFSVYKAYQMFRPFNFDIGSIFTNFSDSGDVSSEIVRPPRPNVENALTNASLTESSADAGTVVQGLIDSLSGRE